MNSTGYAHALFENWRASDVFRTSCVIKTQFNLNMEGGNAKKGKISWTEEETALLLKVVFDYKNANLAGGQDWKTVRTSFIIILQHGSLQLDVRVPGAKKPEITFKLP